jgi:CspA family cold shock protein
MSDRETGTVKWFDNAKGYGFIQRPEGEDVFVHYRSIRGDGFRTLQEGQQVNFNIVKGQKGLQAEDVSAE